MSELCLKTAFMFAWRVPQKLLLSGLITVKYFRVFLLLFPYNIIYLDLSIFFRGGGLVCIYLCDR